MTDDHDKHVTNDPPTSWADIGAMAEEARQQAHLAHDYPLLSSPSKTLLWVVTRLTESIKAMCSMLEEHEGAIRKLTNQDLADHHDIGPYLPGPYRTNPENGNPYRVETMVPARYRLPSGEIVYAQDMRVGGDCARLTPPRVVLTDPLGANEICMDWAEWVDWTPADDVAAAEDLLRSIEADDDRR